MRNGSLKNEPLSIPGYGKQPCMFCDGDGLIAKGQIILRGWRHHT